MRSAKSLARAPLSAMLRASARVLAPPMAVVARTGIGSDACLARGFVPVPTHYYQPVFDPRALPDDVWTRRHELPGVAFDDASHLRHLERLAEFGDECSWDRTGDPTRGYYWDNPSFGFTSAALLHSTVRLVRPKRVVEIGAGMSTLVFRAALERNGSGELVTVDPFPQPFLRGMRDVTLIPSSVQTVDRELFDDADFVFVDSSHVVRTGGDVNEIYLDILPRLTPGTLVHVHDVYLPYEYPREYASRERSRYFWTEQYLLQAFLTLNPAFETVLPGFAIQRDHAAAFAAAFPHYDPSLHRPTTSFYLRRAAS
jgi:predicted O-methyltransferase YrrM